jgi:hypothetical protein
MLTIRPATLEDARYVGERLRVGDAAECAMFGLDGVRAIEESIAASMSAECLLIDGVPAAVFGMVMKDLMGTTGALWILTTDAIESNRIAYARFARRQLERAFVLVDRLENIVDVRYTRAMALLEWLGFEFGPEHNGVRAFWKDKN